MSENDIEILARTRRYDGYFKIDEYRLRHRLHAGGWSGEVRREVFERGHAAAVLPYDPAADAVVLIEQFRIGAWAGDMPAWQIEVVAGIIGEGETAEAVARREALEEAGCAVSALVPVARYLVSPGGTSETCTLFCGRVDSSGAGGIHGLAEEHEDIRVDVVPVTALPDLLARQRISNAVTLVALQWLLLHHDGLRRRWLDEMPATR